MSDDDTLPAPPPSGSADTSSLPAPKPVKLDEPVFHHGPVQTMGLPAAMFVYGGTHSSGHDRMVAEIEADAERRRDEALRDKIIADKHGAHRGNPNDVAALYTNPMTDHPEVMRAYVPLVYLSDNHREVHYRGTGDIVMPVDPAFDNELMLLIYCPRCKEGGMPGGQAILQIRQSNRHWELDDRTRGDLFVDEDGQAQRSAGKVMACESFTCAQCNWRARIDDNKVIPL